MFSGASWRMPDMHNPDTKRFVLCLPYGAAPDNLVGAIRMRLFVPFELIQVGGVALGVLKLHARGVLLTCPWSPPFAPLGVLKFHARGVLITCSWSHLYEL